MSAETGCDVSVSKRRSRFVRDADEALVVRDGTPEMR